MQKKFRRLAAVMLCLTLLAVPALAAEATIDLDYVTIVGEGFAADTFCGVDALYNETGTTLFCNELIERFYSAVYGVTVFTNSGDITAASPSGYWFEVTYTPQPGDIAYVLYTSGTTGRPKGVVVENHSVVNYAEAFEAEFRVGPGDVMLQYSVCSFDIFVEEVVTTLLNGATLAIPSKAVCEGTLAELMDFCERHRVTEISAFPYLLADMNRYRCYPSRLRLLVSGGDVIRASYITWLKDRDFVIYNTYGPSETTVCATYYRVDNAEALDDGTYPVGKAVRGVGVKILDDGLNEVADGETGEICIYGEGVARGYLGNPPEQANFVTLADGTRIYRSGDLCYRMSDGNIAFLRRKDRQVMILGRRVEPEEVENVLNESPCVERGVVRAFTDGQGLAYLTAYFVPSHKNCLLSRIKDFLASRLADFMMPEFFVRMEEIPLTVRGKVNDRLLPVVMKEGDLK